ncbi:hypothetical protein HWV62_42942 [Athelia sp. TMB]|nr:hypothetical protein HWV62_42942 [Athelia sp. TMB]
MCNRCLNEVEYFLAIDCAANHDEAGKPHVHYLPVLDPEFGFDALCRTAYSSLRLAYISLCPELQPYFPPGSLIVADEAGYQRVCELMVHWWKEEAAKHAQEWADEAEVVLGHITFDPRCGHNVYDKHGKLFCFIVESE